MPTRKMVDCRQMPSETNCSLTISGTEEEVLRVATRHAIEEHGHQDSPELRDQLRQLLVDETSIPAYSPTR
jgi:predicted small metal-binding protein